MGKDAQRHQRDCPLNHFIVFLVIDRRGEREREGEEEIEIEGESERASVHLCPLLSLILICIEQARGDSGKGKKP